VLLKHYTTLDEVCSLAHKVKLQKKIRLRRDPTKPLNHSFPFNKESNPPPPKPQNIIPASSSHKSNDPKPPQNPFKKRRCFKCHELGHIASECPKRKVITLVEYETLEEEEGREEEVEKEMEGMEEYVEGADEGELLVLRRTLSGHKDANYTVQRENIFHTRTINGHICSLIVDGGSCTNVASTTLVKKLKIKAEVHP